MIPCDFCQRRAVRTFIVDGNELLRYSCGGQRHDDLARELITRAGFTAWTERITAPFYGDYLNYEVRKTAK